MALFKRKKEKLPAEEFTLPEPPELPREPFHLERDELLPELPLRKEIDEDIDFETHGEKLRPLRVERGENELSPLPEELMPILPSPAVIPKDVKRFISPVEKPIFVKIDKFRESISYLGDIKDKLRSASSLLQNIKEIRQKEDQELQSWERELEGLKIKLEGIDKKLFSDVE